MRRADHSSRGVLPSVVCLSVIDKPHRGGLGPTRAVEALKNLLNKLEISTKIFILATGSAVD